MSSAYLYMRKLACFMSPDIYDWDKNDIELMLDGVGCVETIVDFLRAYQNTFGVDMKDKIEWALLAGVLE